MKPSNTDSNKREDAPAYSRGTPYDQMTRQQKVRFVLKLVVCILTFGFAFPNVMGE